MTWLYLLLLTTLVGCGTLQKWGVRSTSPMFQKSSDGLLKEGNWDFFKASAPGNIKFVELLWEQDRENLVLLSVLVKGYAGYAFAVPETLAFGDELAGVDESPWKKEAIYFYTRSFDYGLLYLKKKKISANDLLGDEKKLQKKLKQLDIDDVMALLYTAQAWGSLINLQKDNIALVAQIPKVKVLFDRVCKLKPNIDQNVCDIFYAQYDASRPKMLGGNPANAEKLYLESIAKHPQNLLIRMSYIQYLLLPAFEQEKYEKEATTLKLEIASWEDMNRDELRNKSPYRKAKGLNLYNAIAKKRFELIEKHKAKIF
jgi:hypothetical protein